MVRASRGAVKPSVTCFILRGSGIYIYLSVTNIGRGRVILVCFAIKWLQCYFTGDRISFKRVWKRGKVLEMRIVKE